MFTYATGLVQAKPVWSLDLKIKSFGLNAQTLDLGV